MQIKTQERKIEKMKILFLDIDGVLNNDETKERTPNKYVGIDDTLIEKLVKILKATDAKVVLSSSWRLIPDDDEDYNYMNEKFKKHGIQTTYKTTKKGENRGWQVSQWLKDRNDVEKFVILDDAFEQDFHDYNLQDNLILTDYSSGLTDKDVEKAIEILNG